MNILYPDSDFEDLVAYVESYVTGPNLRQFCRDESFTLREFIRIADNAEQITELLNMEYNRWNR